MRIRTRMALRDKARRLAQETGTLSGEGRFKWNSAVIDVWGLSWWSLAVALADSHHSVGLTRKVVPIVAPSDTLALPASLLQLRWVLRNDCPVNPTSWAAEEQTLPSVASLAPYRALLEGPYIDPADDITVVARGLRFFPALESGDEIKLVYLTQEPSLGDPSDDGDDTVSVEVFTEPIELAICQAVRQRMVTREDSVEFGRAMAEVQAAAQDFKKWQGTGWQGQGSGVDSYARQGGWSGY